MNAIALHQLTRRIANVVNDAFAEPLWVTAEVSDLRVDAKGHCYMQLIEKETQRGRTLASIRAMIWANRWWLLRDTFAQVTGQPFASGIKAMLLVEVNMHEQYGLSLSVIDIDPTYTLGEMAKRRLEILRQLQNEGVIDMNRELPLPLLPQRIAIVSAEGAAGYGDFVNQLEANGYGLKFYTHLFPAVMQGQQTETSVIEALERIYEQQELFDVVVIIRGGGATLDLASFDSYPLALNVANFPLPVITGIGHDRDKTVLDRVAHTSVKTPTAAAALLIELLGNRLQEVERLQEQMLDASRGRLEAEQQRLVRCANAVRGTRVNISQLLARTEMMGQRIEMLITQRIERERTNLGHIAQTIQMVQPDNILRRGFAIARLDGYAVKSASQVPTGAHLKIQTADGTIDAIGQ